MELLLDPAPDATVVSLWKHPAAWLQEKNLGSQLLGVFLRGFFLRRRILDRLFLFNLSLLDHRFNERAIRWIGSAMTLGSVMGT